MEKDIEIIKARTRDRINLVYETHYRHCSFILIGEPRRRFNWLKLRSEWSQEVLRIREADNFEYVYNFGGGRTQETTWTYYDKSGRWNKKIFFSEPNQNMSKEFNEWRLNIDSNL